jgi:hypothetical protein
LLVGTASYKWTGTDVKDISPAHAVSKLRPGEANWERDVKIRSVNRQLDATAESIQPIRKPGV